MNPEEKLKEPRSLMILALYSLLAIALTWPLSANFTSHIPHAPPQGLEVHTLPPLLPCSRVVPSHTPKVPYRLFSRLN